MQWAAVNTQKGCINDPPQNWIPYEINIASYGQLFFSATVPPTILPWAFLIPHDFGSENVVKRS